MGKNRHRWKIQLGAALASNPFLMNFLHGKISRGGLKAVCVPGLNCYSCPAAAASCPIGALQAVTGSSKFQVAYCQKYLDYIYVNAMGELVKPNFITQHFEITLKNNGLKKIRFHDLRHSCASLLYANGVSLVVHIIADGATQLVVLVEIQGNNAPVPNIDGDGVYIAIIILCAAPGGEGVVEEINPLTFGQIDFLHGLAFFEDRRHKE